MSETNHPGADRALLIVSCRHCGVKNRLFGWALNDPPRRSRCGDCEQPLLIGDEPLHGLESSAYQHPWDRDALRAIHRIPGVDALLRKLVSESFERYERMFHFSSFLHCGPSQLSRVYEIFREAATRLDIAPIPDLFVSHQETMEAYTSGVRSPYVAISAAMIEELRDDELMAVFARELGHCQSGHIHYKVAARLLSGLADSFVSRALGLGSLALKPLQMALIKWDRCAALTADRAALLAVRDPDALIRTMMKLSGGLARLEPQLDRDVFLAQVEQVKEMQKEHVLNRLYLLMQELFRTHPMPLWRTAELLRWAEEGAYMAILAGDFQWAASHEAAHDGQATSEADASEESRRRSKPDDRDDEEQVGEQLKEFGQEVWDQVQQVAEQGSQLLRQWFGNDRSDKEQDRDERDRRK